MNILYIANHLNVGGISSYLFNLSSGLKKRGHNIYIASSGGELSDKFSGIGVKHIRIPIRTKKEVSPKIILSFLKLFFLVKKYKIDLVHTQSRTTQVLGCLLNKYRGIAHIFTGHGFFQPKLSRKLFPCWAQKVIAISAQVACHLQDDFKLAAEKIQVVHNGVDVSKYILNKTKEEMKRSLGLTQNFVIGHIGRLADVKGQTYLIAALPEILRSFPQAQLLIAGEGKMFDRLRRQVKLSGLEKNVIFIPRVDDTRKILSAIDVFVMPSLQEGLGLALMEAMACGLAVVGSDVGGIKTLIQNEVTGLLVKPADQAALSRAILELLNDKTKRDLLGKNAGNFIADNFSQDKMVSQTEGIYAQCLKEY